MTNDRIQNSLYLTAYMLGMKMEELAQALGLSRGYISALCTYKSVMATQTRLAIECLCIKYNKEYYDNYLNNPNISDDSLHQANIFINGCRKCKLDVDKKKDIIYKLLND